MRFPLLLLLPLLLRAASASACAGLEVREPWIRAAPPGAAMLAGYGVIRNTSPHDITLTGVSGAGFGHVMLHETLFEAGEARMRHRGEITIPAGGELLLAPGGLHLMLMKPRSALAPDQQVPLEFDCDGARQTVTFRVRRDAP